VPDADIGGCCSELPLRALLICILREAGALYGSLSDGDVLESGDLIAANGEIYESFRKLLTS
jgi:hypothetical protein